MFRLKLKTDTTLGLFRSVLLVVLVATVSISAVLAIFGVLTDAFGEIGKPASTSAILAAISFAVLLQTFSLPRGRWIDRCNTALGIPVSVLSAFAALDGIYGWRLVERWFGDELGGKLTSSVVSLTLAAAGFGVLLSVSKSKRSVISAIVTGALLWAVWLFAFLNTWFPSWFSHRVMQPWGAYFEMLPFWQKFIAIAGILLGAMAVVTFVLELVGIAHARRAAEGLTRLRGIDVELPDEVHARLVSLAAARGISEAELIVEMVKERLGSS